MLDAAAQLVEKRGGPEFSFREIAERVGVKHTAIYRHFASKEAIVSALATRAFNQLFARFQQAEQVPAAQMFAVTWNAWRTSIS